MTSPVGYTFHDAILVPPQKLTSQGSYSTHNVIVVSPSNWPIRLYLKKKKNNDKVATYKHWPFNDNWGSLITRVRKKRKWLRLHQWLGIKWGISFSDMKLSQVWAHLADVILLSLITIFGPGDLVQSPVPSLIFRSERSHRWRLLYKHSNLHSLQHLSVFPQFL